MVDGEAFRIGGWTVLPKLNEVRQGPEVHHLEPKVVDVLVYLARHPGRVLSKEEILETVWPNTFVTDDVLIRAVVELRKALGDDARDSRFIETVPKRGYRLIAKVNEVKYSESISDGTSPAPSVSEPSETVVAMLVREPWRLGLALASVALLLLIPLGWRLFRETAPAGSQTTINSIAVLPLENLMNDPEQEYFVAGMTDAITTELSRISALRVTSRTSAAMFRGTKKSLPQIARELNVDAIVEGSVLRAGNQVRIEVQLLDGVRDEHLWAESYIRDLKDILDLQRGVARSIAEHVGSVLTAEEERRFASTRQVDWRAYQLYLKGNQRVLQLSEPAFREAIQLYQGAVGIDPEYASAYSGLASAYIALGGWHSAVDPRSVHLPARVAAEMALELDPQLAEGHIALARVHQLFERDWDSAGRAFRRGIELNPGSTYARLLYANFLTAMGRFGEAIEFGRKTLEIDPLSPNTYNELAFSLLLSGDWEAALAVVQRGLNIDPDFRQSHWHLALIFLRARRFEEALQANEKVVAASAGVQGDFMGFAGYIYGRNGQPARARAVLRQLGELKRMKWVPASALAHVYLGLGELTSALDFLERACDEGDIMLVWLKVLWIYDPLRPDPRFQNLLRRMNFPE